MLINNAPLLSSVDRAVKIVNLEDNMNLKQFEAVTENDLKRTTKYHKHWKSLVSMGSDRLGSSNNPFHAPFLYVVMVSYMSSCYCGTVTSCYN